MNKQLKEKLLRQVRSWYALGAYRLNSDGEFVPKFTPEDEVNKIESLITSEKIQMLEGLLASNEVYPEKGIGSIKAVRAVPISVIESELQKLKEEQK